jgi:hypothetical protein
VDLLGRSVHWPKPARVVWRTRRVGSRPKQGKGGFLLSISYKLYDSNLNTNSNLNPHN